MMTAARTPLASTSPGLICPGCGDLLEAIVGADLACDRCVRVFPSVAGLPDLRQRSDRYLSLDAERAKAERLNAVATRARANVTQVASAYYALTDDVRDHRRDRFLRHIHGAVARGEALVERLPHDGLTLEIGCGTGGFLVAAARSGRRVVGVDIAARWLVVARRRLADHGLNVPLVAAGVESLPWPDATFDTVVADSVLEHLDDPAAALAECRRVVKPGGALLLWSPNRFTPTVDPHVGLWGVGWLPRRWVSPYLAFRRRFDWPPHTLSAREARRLVASCGWSSVVAEPPTVTEAWARSRSGRERRLMRSYATALRVPGMRGVLRAFGPLWELRARAESAGTP
jgi:SAM-dependent methyltransferase